MLAISTPPENPPSVSAPPHFSCPDVEAEAITKDQNGNFYVKVKNTSDTDDDVMALTIYMLLPNGDKAAAEYQGDVVVPKGKEGYIQLPALPADPEDGTKYHVTIDDCLPVGSTPT